MIYILFILLLQCGCVYSKLCPFFSPDKLPWKGRTQKAFDQWTQLVVSQNDICPYVYHILTERMKQVSNGERAKSFARYYRKSIASMDDEYSIKIVSSHGRNQADEVVNSEGPSLMVVGNDVSATCSEMYFPRDGSSLDMVFTPEMYQVAYKEIQDRIESESKDDHERYSNQFLFVPTLFFRAIQLGINFSPVTLTCGLAAMSQTFRDRVWYRMLGSCLARSGPAFIKWGKFFLGCH
jgi:hypothetical protein